MEKQDLGNILIVDDSRLSRVLIQDELAEQTCRIFEAGDGSEALAIAGETQLDLILLDIHMPGISGLEVLDILQDDDKLKHIRRGRDAGYPAPPAQIPASGTTALGSYLG